MINAFATFLLLSFSKVLFVSCFSVQHETIQTSNRVVYKHATLFYNPNVNVYGYRNLPFIVLGFSLSTIFVLIPTIALCCYQFARKIPFSCRCCCKQHILSMFMDAFQGHYKDGTTGTYDWRFLAGLYPLLRITVIYTIHEHELLPTSGGLIQVLYCFTVTVLVAFIRPYKRFSHNLIDTFLLILITFTVWSGPTFGKISYSPKHRIKIALLQLLPHLILSVMIFFKVIKLLLQKLKVTHNCTEKLRFSKTFLESAWSWLIKASRGDEKLVSSVATDLPEQLRYGTINY